MILFKIINNATGFDLQEKMMPPCDCILSPVRAAISFQQESALENEGNVGNSPWATERGTGCWQQNLHHTEQHLFKDQE